MIPLEMGVQRESARPSVGHAPAPWLQLAEHLDGQRHQGHTHGEVFFQKEILCF